MKHVATAFVWYLLLIVLLMNRQMWLSFSLCFSGEGHVSVPSCSGRTASSDSLLHDLHDIGAQTAQVPATALRQTQGDLPEHGARREQGAASDRALFDEGDQHVCSVTVSLSLSQHFCADVVSVLAMTMSTERECLKYRLLGSQEELASWGHEYVRYTNITPVPWLTGTIENHFQSFK